jgi:ElaB/YqjD/DUF883 family membrane-anchored ribosome-binding protein
MNEQPLEKNIRQEADRIKHDLTTLVGDSAAQIGSLGTKVNQATEDLATWMEENVSNLSQGIGKITDEAKGAVVDTAAAVKQEVGHGLSQYNTKVQKIADKVPGDFSQKVSKFPWVAISIALTAGFLAGSFLHPRRHPLG